MSRYFNYTGDDYVAHFGIKGMKWGLRRYQNNDGSLTPAGKTRYNKKSDRQLKLEAKYQQKGKSKSEAEAAAKKRIKIERVIAATTVGAGVVLYAKNKPQVDSFVHSSMNKVMRNEKIGEPIAAALPAGVLFTALSVYSKHNKLGRATSMKKAGVSDADIAKQLNLPEWYVKTLFWQDPSLQT